MKKLFLLMLSLFAAAAVSAQVTTSGMTGVVTDSAGEPLVGATVIAVHTPSGTQYGAVTNTAGRYNLQGMRTGGPYTVTFSYVGYRSVEFPGISLSLGETLTRNAYLDDSQELEAVVVTGDGKNSAMNISRAGAVTSVSEEQIELMPSVSRSMNDIMKLTPQASTTTSGLAIGGGNYRQSYVTVDGAAFNNAFGIGGNLPAGGTPISLDALEQVSVAVTPYDVRQSGFTGGAINAVTKSGTNDLKVSAYNYYKSDGLQGARYDGGTLPLNEMKNDVFGFNIGAPIVKDKLFVFANFEYEWNTTPGGTRLARETEDTKYGNNTPYNRPTVAQMEEMRSYLIDKFGYDPGRYQGYSIKTPGWKLMARMDWNINRDHSLNVRFSTTKNKYSSGPSSSTNPMDGAMIYNRNNYGRTSNCALYFENSRYYQEQNFTSLAAELNSRFLDGRMNNTLRYTYSHQYEPRSYDGGLFPMVDILQNEGDTKQVLTTFGTELFTYGNLRDVSTHIVTDELGYSFGDHRIVAGLQFEHNHAENGYMQGGSGWYIYDSWEDFKNNATPLAFRLAHGNNDALAQAYPSLDYMQYSAYLQDDINISDRLKATVGVRFELPVYPTLTDNENKDFTEKFAAMGGYKTSDLPKASVSVSPRFGFNWDMTGERKYILRGGTGLFTGRMPFVWLVSVVGNSNCIQNGVTFYRGQEGSERMPGFHTSVSDMLKEIYGGTYHQQDLASNTAPTILDKHLKMPSTWKSSLALDLRLPRGFDLNIEGIYNKDINAVVVTKLGQQEDPAGIRLPGEPGPRKLWKSQGIKNSDGADIKPLLLHNSNLAGYYASVSAQLSKRWRFGLSASASYTYSNSKNVIDGIGDQLSSAYSTNTFTRNGSNTPELGYASYVSPHRILVNLNYRKEYGKHFASSVGLFYEAFRLGYVGGYSYSRYSYTMGNVTGDGGADLLLYVPTKEQLDAMPFADVKDKEGKVTYAADAQKADFWAFINDDAYLKSRIGEYTERGGAVMPWRHELSFKFAQDFFVNVKGKRNTITVGIDINNVANLLNRNWGNVQILSTSRLLTYKKDAYQFTKPVWNKYASTVSTWSAMFSVRYTFN